MEVARGLPSRLGRVVSCFGLGDWRAFGPAWQGDSTRGQASIQFFRRRQRAGQKRRGLPRPGIGRQCETSRSTIARAPAAKHQLPGWLRAKLRKCLYGDGVVKLANEQVEAPWQRKMVLHHDDMLGVNRVPLLLAAVVSRPAAGCDIRESVNLLHQARWVGEEEAPRSRGIPRKVGRKFSAFLLAVHMRGYRGSRVHHPVEI